MDRLIDWCCSRLSCVPTRRSISDLFTLKSCFPCDLLRNLVSIPLTLTTLACSSRSYAILVFVLA